MSSALAGDTLAYAALMRRHFDDAFAIACRLTASPQDAEDACQEAFARAWFRLDRCGRPREFRGWLMQLVRHHAHNVRRYQALRAAVSVELVPEPAAVGSPSHDAELNDLRDALRVALAALPDVKRAVVRHHDVDGWTHPQIADALDISVLMSRRHLSDARRTLRAQLGDLARDYFSGGSGDD